LSRVAIEARGLEKRFGPIRALRGVDLEVAEGTLFALIGPNGAGKSTLLRLLAGLARPSAGSLTVAGESRDRRRLRGRIGLLGHATFLYPELSVRENLRFAGRVQGVAEPAARTDVLLQEHDLGAFADRPARTLSRGLAQRAAIARSLVHDPPVLLLDEPFTGLDPAAADRLAGQLTRLRQRGRTLVLVSHDVERAARLADRVGELRGGRLVS
jgi:ABC-type multidrug transport system ATPase subunit